MIDIRSKYFPIFVILFVFLVYIFPKDIHHQLTKDLIKISYESEIEFEITYINWANGLLMLNNKYYTAQDAAIVHRKSVRVSRFLENGDIFSKNQNSDTLIIVKPSGQRYVFEKYFREPEELQ
jgi:hypothetical protein